MTDDVERRLADLEQRQRDQGELLAATEALAGTVQSLAGQLADLQIKTGLNRAKQDAYVPRGNFKWWDTSDKALELEIGRLRAWMRDVFEPISGPWAKRVPQCWAEHDLAVQAIDVLSELHKLLYLPRHRSASVLAAQADWWIRIAPGLVEVVAKATAGCEHQSGMPGVPVLKRTVAS